MKKSKRSSRKHVTDSVDVRARSQIVLQTSKLDAMSLEDRRRAIIELNRTLANVESHNTEYDFMLTRPKKSSFKKAVNLLKKRIGVFELG